MKTIKTVTISKTRIKEFLRTAPETKNNGPITDEVRLEKLTSAFFRWATLPSGMTFLERQAMWSEYCDYRDGLPLGTTQKKFNGTYLNPGLRFIHAPTGVKQ